MPLKTLFNTKGYRQFALANHSKEPHMYIVIGSTKTSTIPGISIAGATPELTLTTPCLDIEYLVTGKPLSMDILPVTPTGIPTPALVTRGVLNKAKIPVTIIDAGSYLTPRIPHVTLPSKHMGGRIDKETALPEGYAEKIYREAQVFGHSITGVNNLLVLAESIPGGTTTALGVLIGLGYKAYGKVSSSGPENPHTLKKIIVSKAYDRCIKKNSCSDPFRVVEEMGDPVHITLAGLAAGVLDAGGSLVLSGGTQMASVLALLKRLRGIDVGSDQLILVTTKWLIEDPSSDYPGLVKSVDPNVPVVYYDYDFKDSPYDGLKSYEKGFVKEGVGIGGSGYIAFAIRGLNDNAVLSGVYEEYERVAREAGLL